MTDVRITGGCQCGAVRYAVSGPLGRASICHCRMCQKAFGAFYAPLVTVALADFSVTRGALATFRSSEPVERGFCGDCGTPLTFRVLARQEIDVSIGSLDDPSAARPEVQWGIEGKLPWVDALSELPGEATGGGGPRDHYELISRTNRQHPDHDTASWPPPAPRP
jgi:hypothetical protein